MRRIAATIFSRILSFILSSTICLKLTGRSIPTRISHSDPAEIISHRITPCNRGRCPTCFSVARRCQYRSDRASPSNQSSHPGEQTVNSSAGRQIRIAHRSQTEKHDKPGPLDLRFRVLNRAVPSDKGTIHRARANFTVVPRPERRRHTWPRLRQPNSYRGSRAQPTGRTESGSASAPRRWLEMSAKRWN